MAGRAPIVWAAALAAALPLLLGANMPGDYPRLIAAGRRAYLSGRFQEAGESFEAALKAQPGDALAQAASGCVRYRLQKWAEAQADFDLVAHAQDRQLQEAAEYNAGNCMFRQEQYSDAVDRYRRALILDPTDQDAKFNLELALKRQQERKPPPQEQQQQSPTRQPQPRSDQSPEQQQSQGKPRENPGEQAGAAEAKQQQAESRQLSPEQAAQLLDALASDESKLQRLAPRAPTSGQEKPVDKSW